jgi:hypothetical protein
MHVRPRLVDGDLTIEGLDPRGPGVYTFAVLGGTGPTLGPSVRPR